MHNLLGISNAGTLLARVGLGCVAALASLFILLRPVPAGLLRMRPRRFDGMLLGAMALIRAVLFVAVFGVFHEQVQGDLWAFYLPQARLARQGQWPYRDFYSSYGPFNAPLNGLLLRIHDSGLTLVAFQSVCDVLSVALLLAFLRRFLDETTVRRVGLLMLVQPLMLWNSTVDGRNEALTAVLLLSAMLLVARTDLPSGVFGSAPLVFVKFLPLLYVPTLLVAARRRGLWVLGALLLPVPVFGYMVLHHYPVLQPLLYEGSLETAGSIGYMVRSITGWKAHGPVLDLITLVSLAAVLCWTALSTLRARTEHGRLWSMTLGIAALMLTLVAMSKKTFPAYLTGISGPIAAYVAQMIGVHGRRVLAWIYAGLIWTSLFASTLWFLGLNTAFADQMHELLLHGGLQPAVDFVLVSVPSLCAAALVIYMMRDVRRLDERSPGA